MVLPTHWIVTEDFSALKVGWPCLKGHVTLVIIVQEETIVQIRQPQNALVDITVNKGQQLLLHVQQEHSLIQQVHFFLSFPFEEIFYKM